MSANALISEADYFVMAERAERPLDYINGIVRSRADASQNHVKISSRVTAAFSAPLYGGPYEPVGSGLRVKAWPGTRYYHPDIIVFRDDAEFDKRAPDTLIAPTVLGEILSDATQNIDRIEKLDAYLCIPSLQDYFLIDENRVRIEHYRRGPSGWRYDVCLWRGAEIIVESLEISILCEEIYRRLDVPEGFVWLPETPEN